MRRRMAATILAMAVLAFPGMSPASDLYKWIDENGELHIATSLADVPEKYRDQVTRTKLQTAPAAPTRPVSQASQPEAGVSDLVRFEIPYKNEGSTRRVIIPVTFNGSVTAPMAIDTGSPGMVISVELAAKLGIFSRDSGTLLTEIGGIGGGALSILTIVDSVSVRGARDEFVPTNVMLGISPDFAGLIGMDFLTNYTMSIDSRNKVVVFQETPPDPGARGGHDEGWWRRTFEDFRRVRDHWKEVAKSSNRRPDSKASAFIDFQAREAQRLLLRLDLYASDNAVPRHWR